MSGNELFDQNTPNDEAPVDLKETIKSLSEDNALSLLVGESGKYKTPGALAKAALFKDEHINRLERELAELRSKTESSKKIEDLASMLEKLHTTPNRDLPPGGNERGKDEMPQQNNKTVEVPTLTAADVEALLERKLTSRTAANIEKQNLDSVVQILSENWGPNFRATLKEKAADLGMTQEDLLNLAKTNPKVFLKSVDGNSKTGTSMEEVTPPRSRISPQGNNQPQRPNGAKTEAEWNQIKKTDFKTWNSPESRLKRMNDALALGQSFFSTK